MYNTLKMTIGLSLCLRRITLYHTPFLAFASLYTLQVEGSLIYLCTVS